LLGKRSLKEDKVDVPPIDESSDSKNSEESKGKVTNSINLINQGKSQRKIKMIMKIFLHNLNMTKKERMKKRKLGTLSLSL
jgi:hypothetical protein